MLLSSQNYKDMRGHRCQNPVSPVQFINSLLKRLEQKLNKRNRIQKDRIEITQAELNLKNHRQNVTEIGATDQKCQKLALLFGGYKTKTEDLRPKNEDPVKIVTEIGVEIDAAPISVLLVNPTEWNLGKTQLNIIIYEYLKCDRSRAKKSYSALKNGCYESVCNVMFLIFKDIVSNGSMFFCAALFFCVSDVFLSENLMKVKNDHRS